MPHRFIEHLKEDHEKQRDLGRRLSEADSPADRDKLRQQMHQALYPHMMGEEASIFPYIKNAGDEETRDGALEALQEHHVAKIVLRELMDLNLENEVFKAKAKVLHELNSHHMEEEEEEHFPWLEKNCTSQQLDQLFGNYEEAEEQVEQD